MTDFIQVQTAIDTKEGAQKLATALVENRMAACVHVVGPITSTYWWQGVMETAEEWLCQAKTRADLYQAIEQAIRGLHPYDEPEITALPISAGSSTYLAWIVNETVKEE